MSVNKHKPHLLIIPEDQANSDIILGFLRHSQVNLNTVRIEPLAEGWRKVVPQFERDLLPKMGALPHRHVLLLLDCDNHIDRIEAERQKIDIGLRDRVFVMGLSEEPEALIPGLGLSKSDFGHTLADECVNESWKFWDHEHVRHNRDEANRLRRKCDFLFHGH